MADEDLEQRIRDAAAFARQRGEQYWVHGDAHGGTAQTAYITGAAFKVVATVLEEVLEPGRHSSRPFPADWSEDSSAT
jgi:hypothetical protein